MKRKTVKALSSALALCMVCTPVSSALAESTDGIVQAAVVESTENENKVSEIMTKTKESEEAEKTDSGEAKEGEGGSEKTAASGVADSSTDTTTPEATNSSDDTTVSEKTDGSEDTAASGEDSSSEDTAASGEDSSSEDAAASGGGNSSEDEAASQDANSSENTAVSGETGDTENEAVPGKAGDSQRTEASEETGNSEESALPGETTVPGETGGSEKTEVPGETDPSETTGTDDTEATESTEKEQSKKTAVDGEYEVSVESSSKMFKVTKCLMTVEDGKYIATVTLSSNGYDKLYLGTAESAEIDSTNWITYFTDAEDNYTFTFEVAVLDEPVDVAAHSSERDKWYDRKLTFSSANIQFRDEEETTESGTETEETATPDTEETTPTEGTPDTETTIESVYVVDPDASTSVVDNSTAIADGAYVPDEFIFAGGSGRTKCTCEKVTIADGKAYATIKFKSANYTELKASGNIYTGICGDGSVYTIPVKLNEENTIIGLTTGMSTPKWIEYTIKVSLSEDSEKIQEETSPTESEQTPDTEPTTDTEQTPGTEQPETTPGTEQQESETGGGQTNTDGTLKNGDYTVSVTTSTGKMFKVIDAVLTNNNGSMTAKITLSGTGYDYLYLGTAEEAVKNQSGWIKYTANAEGQYVFEIPVAALDKEILLVAHSFKNDTWYERGIIFEGSTMKLVNGSETTPETTPETETEAKPNKDPEKESKYESDLSGGTSKVDSSTGLADGVYTPDKFSWSGGSGRTSISCSKVTVSGGQAYATIAFGSTNYGYVKANGNKYYPTYSGGTSVFTIPVRLNANNTIIGMTTAMSAAHEITYSIYIYIAGADNKAGASDTTVDKNRLSEEAPEIIGLEYKDEAELEYAEYFKIYYYDQGITMIEVDMASDTDKPAEEAAAADAEGSKETTAADDENAEESEEAMDADTIISELYRNDVVRYLVVPEDAEVPVGLEKEMILIHTPIESVYTDSGQAKETMANLDLEELITAENEDTAEKPEYKELILSKCDLAILSDAFLWDEAKEEITVEEQSDLLYEITERLTTLGIPALVDRSADEKSEEAAAEWIRVYGEIFDCESLAESLYQEAIQ